MFDRSDHTTASCSRLIRSSLQLNQPSRRRSECTTTPVTSPVPSGPGWPSTRTYRKPCVVNRGSNTVPARAWYNLIDLAQRQRLRDDRQVDVEVRRGQVPVAVQPFAVRQRDPAACGSMRLPSGSATNAIRTPASGDGPGGMTGRAPQATARS